MCFKPPALKNELQFFRFGVKAMIEIDGSYGEGGGAVLRNAVALSAVLGEPVRIWNIRAGRKEPGLKMQHLTGVKALADICGAEVSGLAKGSTEITFIPGKIKGGKHRLDIGTAGSITLVLQSLMPALAFAEKKTELELIGGTNVAWSPPADYMENVMLPVVKSMGFKGELAIEKRGWYPAGGGVVKTAFEPAGHLDPLRICERGNLLCVEGISVASNLPEHVVERQATAARKALSATGIECRIRKEIAPATCPGSAVVLWARFSSGAVLGGSSIGERGKPAEKVGEEAAKELLAAIESGAALDVHLCDQMLIFAALAEGESEFSASAWSSHSATNAWLIQQFIKKGFQIKNEENGRVRVRIEGIGLKRV